MFKDEKALEAAIDELTGSGFDRAEISLLAGTDTVEAKLGHHFRTVAEHEDDAAVPQTFYIARESIGDAERVLVGGLLNVGAAAGAFVASSGILAAAALAGGTGGLIGATLGKLVGDHHALHLENQPDRGGLLLWIHLRD